MDPSAMPLTAPSKASSLPSPHSAEDQNGNQSSGSAEPTPLPAITPSPKPGHEAVRRANKRSLADTVKMRTRGALAEDTATAEASQLEGVAKKRAKAAKVETGGGPAASPRAPPPTHSQDAGEPNILTGRGGQDETRFEDFGSSPGAALDGLGCGAQAEARQAVGDAGATQAHAGQAAGRKGGGKSERKVAPSPAAKVGGDIHCHYCGTRESTYWRRGPDGPKTLCNSCGLNWFRQRPMQREQVEVGNLMAAAVAAAALKRPANSLKDGPEKRKREEKKDGKQLLEQLHGTKGAHAQQQPGAKRRKGDGGAGAGKPERAGGQAVASSLKGLQRTEKGSIRRKLGDAAVKKAALIKRTPSQLSLVGLLESAAAAPPAPPELPPAAAVKPTGVLKGARFSPLKQAQTRLGAQKLLAVLNVIKQKKGLGRVTSTASLESVPEEDPLAAQPDGIPGISGSGVPGGTEVLASSQDALRGGWEPGPTGASTRRPTKTGARSQRRPNTALLQGASFLPWKARPRGWESSSLTFAAAESRLLKPQAAAPAAHGRSPLQTRAEAGPIGAGPEQEGVGGGNRGAAPDPQQRARLREGGSHEAAAGGAEAGEGGSDDDGFAGYGVLRKLLEEVDAPPTSPPAKGRPPLNKKGGAPLAKKLQRSEQPLGSQGPSARAGLNSYESFEDLVMGTAGGMKRFESFEDLALRVGPVFARVESFEELALRAGPAMRRFESFEDLAMRSQPVVEPPPHPAPSALPAAHVAGRGEGESSAEAGSEGEAGSRDGAGRRSGREKKQKTWEWAVVDGPKRRRKDARDDKGLPREGPDGPAPWRSGTAQGQRKGEPGQALQPPRGSQGRGRGGAQQFPGMLGPGESPTAGSLESAQRGEGTEEPVLPNDASGSAEGRLLAAPGQAGGLPQHSAGAAAAGQPGAALLPNGLRYALRVPAAAQPSGSAGPTASLARNVLGLGPRGVSARALHLLVDCAVEPEPAADVATLMADLQTLAIGTADKRGGSDGGQEQGRAADGAAGGMKAGFAASFTLPNGRAVKQVAPVAHAVRLPAGAEVASDGAAEGRGGGVIVELGAPEAGPPAAEQEDGAVGPSKATSVTPRGAPAAVDKDARAAQLLQVPAGEPELHCAEVLQSPEDLPC